MRHNKSQVDKNVAVAGAVVVAGLVGAAVGMLVAPKRGSESREDLKNSYNGVKNKAQDTAMDARDRLKRGVDAARTKTHDVADTVADKTKDIAETASDKVKGKADDAATQAETLADHIEAESTRRRRKPM